MRKRFAFSRWWIMPMLVLLGWRGTAAQDQGTATQDAITTASVDFERHVAPLLGKYGCNSAACHGAFSGKSDLQLSLFGYSAAADFHSIKDRVDVDQPTESLLLQKPSGDDDHEGGIRFKPESQAYATIRQWIESGATWKPGSGDVQSLQIAPAQIALNASANDDVTLSVRAEFSDGTSEDVTRYCKFTSRDEGIARVNRRGTITPMRVGDTSIIVSYGNAFGSVSVFVPHPGPANRNESESENSNAIDFHIREKLNRLNIAASPRCSDAEFLRRVTLDVIGTIPTVDSVKEFCSDDVPNKRERKIDELLADPMHAALWATRMCDITKCDVSQMGEDDRMGSRRAQMWHDWFRKRFEANESYAEIARGVITATSREDLAVDQWIDHEATAILQSRKSHQNTYAERDTLDLYWRRISDDGRFPTKAMAELTTVAFTGVRIGCAQCHKHPFDRWTQDDYAATANIFSRVTFGSSTELNVAIMDRLDQRRAAKDKGENLTPLPRIREVFTSKELGRQVPGASQGDAWIPRPLDGHRFDDSRDLRTQFWEWLVESDNPYFARSFANRVWAVYFGMGIVDPVDDFSATNLPSHPKLLDDLAKSFRKSDFDVRALERQILMSDAYQRSATPLESNRADQRNYARQQVRALLAEVALDVINAALGTQEAFGDEVRPGSLAIEIGTNQLSSDAGQALRTLGRGQRESVCDCDRRSDADLRQFLFMVNGDLIHDKIRTGSIRELLSLKNKKLVIRLYLRCLGREPSATELKLAIRHIRTASERETGFDDLVWAIINTREFITNH